MKEQPPSESTLETSPISESAELAETIGFDLLGPSLGDAVKAALEAALSSGVIFADGDDPIVIFRKALTTSIRSIQSHPRGKLFQEFLLKGPYEDVGDIPAQLIDQRLSDADVAAAITFIHSFMVNCFKGALTELLAAAASLRLMKALQHDAELPPDARLYVGDSVAIHRTTRDGLLKGADQHILMEERAPDAATKIRLVGVTEVKSYFQSERRLREQLDKHVRRAKQGLRVAGTDYLAERIDLGRANEGRVVRIAVLPSDWKLPRTFRFETSERGHMLHVDEAQTPRADDHVIQTAANEWRIELRWSKEAIAEAAYEMTFWYMGKIGEIIYAKSPRDGWERMTPSDAGRNAS